MHKTDWKEVSEHMVMRVAIIGVLAILALFLLAQTIATVENFGTSANPPTNTITVTGDGTATAIPDTATISFGGTVTASTVASAETQLTNTMQSALNVLKQNGIPSSDITTSSYNVSPHYTPPVVCTGTIACPAIAIAPGSGSSNASGYDVSETVTVKITDTSKVSAILGGLARANVTEVTGPDYGVGDPTAVQSQARGMAIANARQQAQVLASQLGVSLGKVVSFSDNSGGVIHPTAFAASAAPAASVPNPSVPAGSNQYTDDVSITYEIN